MQNTSIGCGNSFPILSEVTFPAKHMCSMYHFMIITCVLKSVSFFDVSKAKCHGQNDRTDRGMKSWFS